MTLQKTLEEYQAEITRCVRCGACQAHCPVYLETGREGSVARGKIVLAASVLTGAIGLDAQLQHELSLCLLCGSCVTTCPNQVPTDAIVAALRRRITADHGLSAIGKGVAALTGSPSLLRGVLRGAGLLSPLLFKKIPAASGLQLRFSPDNLKERSLPPIPNRHLFARLPEFLEEQPDTPAVGFFAGCAITYLYPEVGEALVGLLQAFGYPVFLPKNQGCCGMPALSSGNGPLLHQLAATNLEAFAGRKVSCILTACASCHGALAGHYAEKAGNRFATPIVDIHAFLKQEGIIDRLAALPKWDQRQRVTYHDPCHMRTQGITQAPRELLRALPQVEFVEMTEAALCCGLGGTFSAAHPELSRAIGDRKLAGLEASGATLVASGCPGCVMQLQDIVNRAGMPIKAVHTLDLIQQAMTETPR
jgi:glycolate oxidase iron-sulfur subunit